MITKAQIKKLEKYTDALFQQVGIDTNYSKHFIERVNNRRNKKPITIEELRDLFKKVHRKYALKIAKLGAGAEAVMKDMESDINVPFAINWDDKNLEFDLVGKTVMRKKNFKTRNKTFRVESLQERQLTPAEEKKKEEIVKELKKKEDELRDKHGEDWKSVMYAIATDKAKSSTNESFSEEVEFMSFGEFVAEEKKKKAAKKKKKNKKGENYEPTGGKIELSGKKTQVDIDPTMNEI